MILYPQNDNIIRLKNHRDLGGLDPADPVNAAIVTANITDSDGQPVGAPIPMAYILGSYGQYEGVAPASLPLVDGQVYGVTVTSNDGPGRQGYWSIVAHAQTRNDV